MVHYFLKVQVIGMLEGEEREKEEENLFKEIMVKNFPN